MSNADQFTQAVEGTLARGYGYAGIGIREDSPSDKSIIPWGTVLLQALHFVDQGLDFDTYFDRCYRPGHWRPGTMNILVAPLSIVELKPDYVMKDVVWYTSKEGKQAKENFLLTELEVEYEGRRYKGLHYFVDPASKTGSPQPNNRIEVIAEPIMGLEYDDTLTVHIDPTKIVLAQPGLRDVLTYSGKAADLHPAA